MIKAEWTSTDALDLQPTCNQFATDYISRQAAIEAIIMQNGVVDKSVVKRILTQLPSIQQEDWMAKNKDSILQAGMEGREVEFRIDGRLFAIREKAQ